MFYKVSDTVEEIIYDYFDDENLYIGMLTLEQLIAKKEELQIPEATIATCQTLHHNQQNIISVYDHLTFGLIDVIDRKDVRNREDKFALYIRNNLFLVVTVYDEDHSIQDALFAVLAHQKQAVTLEKIIYSFLNRLIFDENMLIEDTEIEISQLEKQVIAKKTRHFEDEMLNLRKKLLLMNHYYERLLNFSEVLMANENEIFKEENLRYFKMFTSRVERYSDSVSMLREYISQVREAYQAQMDYDLNSTMKLFTVVTTIFLPLTLIVGWYGMNFEYMPELSWKYGYPLVFLLSLFVVIGCILLFRKKKLL